MTIWRAVVATFSAERERAQLCLQQGAVEMAGLRRSFLWSRVQTLEEMRIFAFLEIHYGGQLAGHIFAGLGNLAMLVRPMLSEDSFESSSATWSALCLSSLVLGRSSGTSAMSSCS